MARARYLHTSDTLETMGIYRLGGSQQATQGGQAHNDNNVTAVPPYGCDIP